jgi:hypothetical protein
MKYIKLAMQRHQEGLLMNAAYDAMKKEKISFRLFYLFHGNLSESTKNEMDPRIGPVEIVHLSPADMKDIAARAERDYSEGKMLQMLADGCICMGVKFNRQIVAHCWNNLKNCKQNPFGLNFNLPQTYVYNFGMRTLKRYKGNGLAPYLKFHNYRYLLQMGKKKYLGYIMYSNVQSIKFHRKLNAKKSGIYLNIRFFGKYNQNFRIRRFKNDDL